MALGDEGRSKHQCCAVAVLQNAGLHEVNCSGFTDKVK